MNGTNGNGHTPAPSNGNGNGNGHKPDSADPQPSPPTKATGSKVNFLKARKARWKRAFIEALKKMPNIARACRVAGCDRRQCYNERETDPQFRADWDDAEKESVESLHRSLYNIATRGEVESVWMKDQDGKPVKVETKRKVNVTAAIFLLKAHDPARYRERISAELTTPPDQPLALRITPEAQASLERVYAKRGIAPKPA